MATCGVWAFLAGAAVLLTGCGGDPFTGGATPPGDTHDAGVEAAVAPDGSRELEAAADGAAPEAAAEDAPDDAAPAVDAWVNPYCPHQVVSGGTYVSCLPLGPATLCGTNATPLTGYLYACDDLGGNPTSVVQGCTVVSSGGASSVTICDVDIECPLAGDFNGQCATDGGPFLRARACAAGASDPTCTPAGPWSGGGASGTLYCCAN